MWIFSQKITAIKTQINECGRENRNSVTEARKEHTKKDWISEKDTGQKKSSEKEVTKIKWKDQSSNNGTENITIQDSFQG